MTIYWSQQSFNGSGVFTIWRQVSALRQRREELHSHAEVNQGGPTIVLLNSRREHAFILFDFCSSFHSAHYLKVCCCFFLVFTFFTSEQNRMCKPTKKSRHCGHQFRLTNHHRFQNVAAENRVSASREKNRLKVNLILNNNYSNQDLFGSNECLLASKRDEPNHDANYHRPKWHLYKEH